ncbi:MAG TPA: RNase H family protein [Cyclobacteriaceae bacterium]|jgi:ribonuclease HI|nr:RNase H family protein [Cyclobacteriaceae bacterium]
MNNDKNIINKHNHIILYTDGSCNTQFKTGAWAAIIFINDQKNTLQGIEHDTTHQRMELRSVIESLKWLTLHHADRRDVHLYTDSQYIVDLPSRRTKLVNQHFATSKSIPIRNADLVEEFYRVVDSFQLQIKKVKAHQKKSNNQYDGNREVDQLCRKATRNALAD